MAVGEFIEHQRDNERRDTVSKMRGMREVMKTCKTHGIKKGNHTFKEAKECLG